MHKQPLRNLILLSGFIENYCAEKVEGYPDFQCFLVVSSLDKLPYGASDPVDGLDRLHSLAQLVFSFCIDQQEDASQLLWLT